MSELIVTLLINATCAILAVWLYVHALRWVQFRFSGSTKTVVSLAIFFLMAALIVLSMGYVFSRAPLAEIPWWVILAAWVVSLLPALVFWARRGRTIRI